MIWLSNIYRTFADFGDKKWWFFGAIGVIAAVGFFLVGRSRLTPVEQGSAPATEISDAAPPNTSTNSLRKRTFKRARSVLSQRLTVPFDSTAPAANTSHEPKGCQVRFDLIASLSLTDLYREISAGTISGESACSTYENGLLLQRQIKTDVNQCISLFAGLNEDQVFGDDGKTQNDPKLAECKTAWLFLRAALIDGRYPDAKPEQISTQVLANKLLSRLGEAFSKADTRAILLEFAKELANREPDLYAAHKAVAVLSVFEPGENGKANFDNPKFIDALNVCKEFGVNDPELEEITFMKLVMTDKPVTFSEAARKVLQDNPKSAIANYYLAADYFKAGNRVEALKLLQLSHQYAPHDARIKETLEEAKKTNDSSMKIFKTTLSISFDDDSLVPIGQEN